ncbi:hypothetical protein POVCU2_0032280 [Plasmodium ovale curtisi]|uniref:Uncharacterized protein n=1 Tax=Plasmodium ovale curtisi TaxID=864141 RepID=A0A1A8W0W2_PLAOA|nr:hypothetical protein POVCU2_0032280 [Plasmodium ovale curtisi]
MGTLEIRMDSGSGSGNSSGSGRGSSSGSGSGNSSGSGSGNSSGSGSGISSGSGNSSGSGRRGGRIASYPLLYPLSSGRRFFTPLIVCINACTLSIFELGKIPWPKLAMYLFL